MMRTILSAAMYVATGILVFALLPYAPAVVRELHTIFVAAPPDKSVGVLASLITGAGIFLYIAVTQNIHRRKYVTRYRWAELRLVQLGKMTAEEIVTYHARYNWFSYAGMSFSTLLIITSLLYTDASAAADQNQSVIVFLSLALLGVASIMLAVVDLFHTNTLSPLITVKKRFDLIDSVIRIGGAAIILQICAISIFMSLINAWLSIFSSAAAFWLVIHFSLQRGIPLNDLKQERNLDDEQVDEVRRA